MYSRSLPVPLAAVFLTLVDEVSRNANDGVPGMLLVPEVVDRLVLLEQD